MKRKLCVIKNYVRNRMWNMKHFMLKSNAGMGTVEIILIIVVIFTIYMGCK